MKIGKTNNSKYPHKRLFKKSLKLPEQIKSPHYIPLPFLASMPDPRAVVVVGLSSELLCGVTFVLAVLAFPFLSFLEVSLGTSAMSLWNRRVYTNPNECHLKFNCLAHFLYHCIQSVPLNFSPCNPLHRWIFAGRRKHYMVSSVLKQRMKPRKEDPCLLQAGYTFSFASYWRDYCFYSQLRSVMKGALKTKKNALTGLSCWPVSQGIAG